jgi:uncharacterized DUF497 family protein
MSSVPRHQSRVPVLLVQNPGLPIPDPLSRGTLKHRNIMRIEFTKHAKLKLIERKISLEDINTVVSTPLLVEEDRFDAGLRHFIGRIQSRFLRVIVRREGEDEMIVISAFFDRRLLRRMNRDKT